MPTPTPTTPARLHPARFPDLIAAEWLKLSCRRLLLLSLFLAPPCTAALSWFLCSGVDLVGTRGRTDFDRLAASFDHGVWGLLMIGAAVIGALSFTGEDASGLIRTTFIAVPDRRRVLLAKAAVSAVVATAVGVPTAIASFGTSQAVLSGKGLGLALGDPGVARGFLAACVLLPTAALLGLAVGVLVRHRAGAVFAVFVTLGVVPEPIPEGGRFLAEAANLMPRNAWSALVGLGTADDELGPYPPSVTHSWLVLAGWPLALLTAAALVLRRRDL
ncbi:ABC transporter permease [Embleya hyalina]|uniref:ABC transporter permease n=1 Tax=Embleya hyalina TaxID=516124 RepID=A0A401YK29_9ACTN|nr:ABC transporter permease [Embleya hyalina]GCD94889.1 ABC transporter permease [Embleya hyalina]